MNDSNETARLASAKSGREKRSKVETLLTAPGDLAPTRDIWELNNQTKIKNEKQNKRTDSNCGVREDAP